MNKDIKQWLDGIITTVINNLNVINNVKNAKGEKGDKGQQGDKGIKGETGERGEPGETLREIPISRDVIYYGDDMDFIERCERDMVWFHISEYNYYIIVNKQEDGLSENEVIKIIANEIKKNIDKDLDIDMIEAKIEKKNKSYTNPHSTHSIFYYHKEY